MIPAKVLVSHQPDFLPYMGVIYKLFKADIVVFSDDVQFSKSGMHNYNYIKTPDGKHKLRLQVDYKTGDIISQVKVKYDKKYMEKLVKTIQMAYCKAPYYEEIFPDIADILTTEWENLWLLNVLLLNYIMVKFGIKAPFYLSSDLALEGVKAKRIESMIQHFETKDAIIYLAGTGSAEYLKDSKERIAVSDYKETKYMQLHGEFIENLSVLDYIMNNGWKLPKGWNKIVNVQNIHS